MLASAQREGQGAKVAGMRKGDRRLTTLCLKPFMTVDMRARARQALRQFCGLAGTGLRVGAAFGASQETSRSKSANGGQETHARKLWQGREGVESDRHGEGRVREETVASVGVQDGAREWARR